MSSSDKPRLIPTGNCWCGCGREVGLGKFFAQGHDQTAESALIALKCEGSVPHFLHAHGCGPQHSVTGDGVQKTDWDRGAPASIARRNCKYHSSTGK
ncbi:hypothetical protein [Streptomyces sp. NPDC047725]|uniref:hypothetical protein n=1 Tax=Streptomyces sp. NPDC047725 TaxID=3365487 RepID=UPI0037161E3B